MNGKLFIGIDVSKDWLDIAVHAGDEAQPLATLSGFGSEAP